MLITRCLVKLSLSEAKEGYPIYQEIARYIHDNDFMCESVQNIKQDDNFRLLCPTCTHELKTHPNILQTVVQ